MTTLDLSKPEYRKRPLLGWGLHDGLVVTRRHLIQYIRVPESLFFAFIQPVMFILLFAYVFGGAIPIPGSDDPNAYRQYLMPGIFGQTVAFAAAASTVGLAEDMQKGFIDRFRVLPMADGAVLFGRTFSDALVQAGVLIIMSITGFIVGWRINDGIANALLAYALFMLFAYAVAWIGAWIGLHMPNTQTANTAGLVWLFPATFISNAFVPIDSMPTVLQAIAAYNPTSTVVLAGRQLFGNPTGPQPDYWSLQNPVLYTIISCGVTVAIFSFLAVRRFRKASGK